MTYIDVEKSRQVVSDGVVLEQDVTAKRTELLQSTTTTTTQQPRLLTAYVTQPVSSSSSSSSSSFSSVYLCVVWLNGLLVSALGIRTRRPGFEYRVAPLLHWVATLGKLFTHIASPVSQLQETGVQTGVFGA